MECESPRLVMSSSHPNTGCPSTSSAYHLSSRPLTSGNNGPPPGLLHGAYHLQSRIPARHQLPPPHIVTAALLESGGVQTLNSRINYGGPHSVSGPSSLSDFVSMAGGGSNPNFPPYINMNLSNSNSGPPSVGSLECTQTGSLNMPLLQQSGGIQAFTNMNMNGLPPHHHHVSSSLNFQTPLNQFLTSCSNMPSSGGGGGIPPFGLVQSGGGGSFGGNSTSSGSSSDVGLATSNAKGNLLMSLSSRTRQGQGSSEEERDESPMVCVQQSPVGVTSH